MLAAIDLGTSSARLLVGNFKNGKIETVLRFRRITRMGEGLGEKGLVQEEGIKRTLASLKEFAEILKDLPISQLRIFGTSAARRALDISWLEKGVKEIFNLELQILNGDEEASLSYKGAVRGLGLMQKNSHLPVVVDIGGGSTEICTILDTKLKSISLEIGAIRGTENPALLKELDIILKPIKAILLEDMPLKLIGVGGTATSLAAIEQSLKEYDSRFIHGYSLSFSKVEKLLQRLKGLSLAQRRKLPGLEPERADIIIAGAKILWSLMVKLKSEELIISETDLLDGMLFSMAGVD